MAKATETPCGHPKKASEWLHSATVDPLGRSELEKCERRVAGGLSAAARRALLLLLSPSGRVCAWGAGLARAEMS